MFVGVPGGTEMLVVLGIFVLLFGASRLPKLARAVGQSIGEFQKGRKELEQDLSDANGGEI